MRASEVIVEWSWILDKSLPRDLDLVRVANIDKVVRYEAFFVVVYSWKQGWLSDEPCLEIFC